MIQLEWKTVQKYVNELIPFNLNPRKISETNRMKMIESLKKFNLVDIPVIDTDGIIISGHQRLNAMQAIGRGDEMIDVRQSNRKLSEKEIKEYNLLANSHFGEFDFELMETNFDDINFDLVPIDMGKIEFENSPMFDKHIDKFFKNKAAQNLEVKEDDFEIPDLVKTDIVPGDLFQIGPHRLLCGDSTDSDQVARLMDGDNADLYLTDPPYGVSYSDKNRYLNAISPGNRIQIPIENDSKTPEEMYVFWKDVFTNAFMVLKEKSSYYIFSPQGGDLLLLLLLQAVRDSGFALKHILIWAKNNHVLGRCDYNYKHEPIVYGWKQKGSHEFYGMGDMLTSVWNYNKPLRNDLHPTMKPIEVLSNAIKNSTKETDLIFDNFLGSGSTMVAAHQLNRKCYGMEISPDYCQVIIDRMKKLDPTIQVTRNGDTFTQIP